jgi:hypothetical protein
MIWRAPLLINENQQTANGTSNGKREINLSD